MGVSLCDVVHSRVQHRHSNTIPNHSHPISFHSEQKHPILSPFLYTVIYREADGEAGRQAAWCIAWICLCSRRHSDGFFNSSGTKPSHSGKLEHWKGNRRDKVTVSPKRKGREGWAVSCSDQRAGSWSVVSHQGDHAAGLQKG
jgi:hypothetical protein